MSSRSQPKLVRHFPALCVALLGRAIPLCLHSRATPICMCSPPAPRTHARSDLPSPPSSIFPHSSINASIPTWLLHAQRYKVEFFTTILLVHPNAHPTSKRRTLVSSAPADHANRWAQNCRHPASRAGLECTAGALFPRGGCQSRSF